MARYLLEPGALRPELPNCPVCGVRTVLRYCVSEGRQILRCGTCQVLFVWPRPNSELIRSYFSNTYIADLDRTDFDFGYARRAMLERHASRIKQLLPLGGRLLDVGTASGCFLTCMKDDRWLLEGLEPSGLAAKVASSRTGAQIHHGYITEVKLPSDSYDVVTSLDEFYFHEDPNRDIQEIRRILKTQGIIIMELPNLRFRLLKNTGIFARIVYGPWRSLNAREHIFFYSRRAIIDLMKRYDFDLVSVFPEQSPHSRKVTLRVLNDIYFAVARSLYRLGGVAEILVPKELFIFRKCSP